MKIGVGRGATAQGTGEWNMAAVLGLAQRLGGWITPDLVARFVWPKASLTASRKTASELLGRAVRNRWLLARPLPRRRLLYVVTKTGARWLSESEYHDGSPGVVGTEIGKLEAGVWTPPATLTHDLRAARWLVHLANQGWEIRTSWELARLNPEVGKLPDGLASEVHGQWHWIEVEGARKSGERTMGRMAEELIAIEQGQGPRLRLDELDHAHPVATMIVLPEPKPGLNHRLRIQSAVYRKRPLEPVTLQFYTEVTPWTWEHQTATVDGDGPPPS